MPMSPSHNDGSRLQHAARGRDVRAREAARAARRAAVSGGPLLTVVGGGSPADPLVERLRACLEYARARLKAEGA